MWFQRALQTLRDSDNPIHMKLSGDIPLMNSPKKKDVNCGFSADRPSAFQVRWSIIYDPAKRLSINGSVLEIAPGLLMHRARNLCKLSRIMTKDKKSSPAQTNGPTSSDVKLITAIKLDASLYELSSTTTFVDGDSGIQFEYRISMRFLVRFPFWRTRETGLTVLESATRNQTSQLQDDASIRSLEENQTTYLYSAKPTILQFGFHMPCLRHMFTGLNECRTPWSFEGGIRMKRRPQPHSTVYATGVRPEPQITPERSFLWLDESVSFKLQLKVDHLSRSIQKRLQSSLTIMVHISGRRSHGLKGNVLYPVTLHQPSAENWTSFQIHYDLFYSSYRFKLRKRLEFRGRRWGEKAQWLEREFTDRKIRSLNPTSVCRLLLSRLRQPGSIPALVLPLDGMAVRHQKNATAERLRPRPSVRFNIPECHLEADEYYPWYSVSITEGNDVLDFLEEHISWPFSHQRQQGVYLCTAHLGETYVHQEKTQKNRNSIIQEQSLQNEWKHVTSSQNLADLASRGIKELDDLSHWMYGPKLFNEPKIPVSSLTPDRIPHVWYPLGYVNPETRVISGSGATFTCMVNDWRLPKNTPVSIWWERRQDEHNLFRSRNASLFSVKSTDELAIFVYDCVIMSGETIKIKQGNNGNNFLPVIDITETLDGENTGDPVVNAGDNKQLECDLLPLGVVDELHGLWKATVNGDAADIVEVDHTANRAKIRPRNPPGYYTQETSFVVNCVLFASDDTGTIIRQFNRTVTVKSKRQLNHLNCHLYNFRCNSKCDWSILQVNRLDAACDLLAPQRGMRTVADEIPMPFRRSDFEQAHHLDTGRACELPRHLKIRAYCPPLCCTNKSGNVKRSIYTQTSVFPHPVGRETNAYFSLPFAESDVSGVLFVPPDGILHVGSPDEIQCILDGDQSVSKKGHFILTDMRSRDDLLSTDNRSTPVRIRPPAGETTYPKHGSTVVRCTWEHTNTGDRFERDLTVRILPANLTGTLDRENTDDPVLDVGDNKQLECDLLPLGLAAELDGVWKATVNGAAADIVEIDHTANRAKIRPRNPPGYYTQETSFVVNCVLLASDDNETVILQFNRTVTVNRLTRAIPTLRSEWAGLGQTTKSSVLEALFQAVINLQFMPRRKFRLWWIPVMLLWFLILVATVLLIGQLCGSKRDWDFMRADIQNIVHNVQTTPLVTWNPTKPIPPVPVPPRRIQPYNQLFACIKTSLICLLSGGNYGLQSMPEQDPFMVEISDAVYRSSLTKESRDLMSTDKLSEVD
ncbi:hypothetical protein CLF_109635 [Clonorchis sinensis]|uniref:Ig-like domain-containing protein n=1 Tax=Clonorchis sinensis TaxID=79923 RepID=G7YSS9_CLOSI|nr:hypothetical protein CLF_109635 [Clonorchis sinensis]